MAVIVALITIVFLGLARLGRGRSWRQKWPAFVGVPVVAAIAIGYLLPQQVAARFSEEDPTRLAIWRDTLHLIGAYPLFGCGLGAYEPGIIQFKTAGPGADLDQAHNDYLQYLAELGLVGFFIGLWPIAMVLRRLWNAWARPTDPHSGWLTLACAGSMLAIGLHSLVDFNLYVLPNMMVFAWVLGIAAYSGRSPRRSDPSLTNRLRVSATRGRSTPCP
jgi:O-antigen ligase